MEYSINDLEGFVEENMMDEVATFLLENELRYNRSGDYTPSSCLQAWLAFVIKDDELLHRLKKLREIAVKNFAFYYSTKITERLESSRAEGIEACLNKDDF